MELDWNDVKSVVLKNSSGKTLKTNPEIWCGGRKQWPVDIPVAAPYQNGQTGTVKSGTATFNITAKTAGVASITGTAASDTSTHYATITLKSGYCWADGYDGLSRQVAYALKKTTASFRVTTNYSAGNVRVSVSGFSPDARYKWSDVIDAGYTGGHLSYTAGDYVRFDSIVLTDSQEGMSVLASHYVGEPTSSYEAYKLALDVSVEIAFEDGALKARLTGVDAGNAPSWSCVWGGKTVGTVVLSSQIVDLRTMPDGGYTVSATAVIPESALYLAESVSGYIWVSCVDDYVYTGSYSSTCKARTVEIDGGTYAVFGIDGLPSGSPYTRYSFRRSSYAAESAWGESTYWRRYYIPKGMPSPYLKTMPSAAYSGGKWKDNGQSAWAWYGSYDRGHTDGAHGVQLWISNGSGYNIAYFGNKPGVSGPPN